LTDNKLELQEWNATAGTSISTKNKSGYYTGAIYYHRDRSKYKRDNAQ
jgi:hypothetical protein